MKLEKQKMYAWVFTSQVYNAGSKTFMLRRYQASMYATSYFLWDDLVMEAK